LGGPRGRRNAGNSRLGRLAIGIGRVVGHDLALSRVRVRAPVPARGRRRSESLTGLVGGESVVGAPFTFRFAAPLSSPCDGPPMCPHRWFSLEAEQFPFWFGLLGCLIQTVRLVVAPSGDTGTVLSWKGCVNSKARRSRMLVGGVPTAPSVSARVLRFRVRSSVVHAFVCG
jgi:hypothetical protein